MENKKKLIGLIVAIVVLLLIVVGATYAYFAAQLGTGAQTDVDITAESVDSLTFTTGDPISFSITQDNFKQGGNNLSGVTTATANLVAAKDTTATYNYYVYLDINKNDFIYTTEEQTAEVILSITKPDNTKITSIDGLEYLTVNGVSGFDITESTDLIKIAENYEITTTSNIEQTWTVEITFINLESNQSANAGRSIQAELKIQKEKEEGLLADYIKSLYTTDGENDLYLFDGEGTYTNADQEANDGSYRYIGGDYKLTEKAINEGYSEVFGDLIIIGVNNRNYESTANFDDIRLAYASSTRYLGYKKAINQAIVDGYLTNNNINNYVCFGSDTEECPVDSLYRIIGVFGDKVKLIKYVSSVANQLGNDGAWDTFNDEYGNAHLADGIYLGPEMDIPYYNWNKYETKIINDITYANIWDISRLNKINLNTNYVNNIGTKWSNMITSNKWVVGGIHPQNIVDGTLSSIYNYEINNPSTEVNSFYKSKIGLIYISDYYYASKIETWSAKINTQNVLRLNNWMNIGQNESTITRRSDIGDKTGIYIIHSTNELYTNQNVNAGIFIRPAFYLSSGVHYVSGDGTQSNPYRIA